MPFISSVRGSYGAQGRFGKKRGLGSTSTGGTITTAGGYRIHTFQRALNGTSFTPDGDGTVEYLVVGGGAGGAQQHSGGGGAGGMLTGTLSVTAGTGYTITVGEGGAAQPNSGGCSNHTTPAGNGGQSQFSSVLAYGGGYPGCYATFAPYGGPNGSGGGGRNTTNPTTGGPGTAGQGYNGGASDYNHVGGGGGGAGEAGFDGSYIVSNGDVRSGGNGLQSSISGTATFYAGGGGGGSHNQNRSMFGGNGGGGNGGKHSSGSAQAGAGTDGLGGGGGGNGGCEPNHPGYPPGRGGHGVVIIRYQL